MLVFSSIAVVSTNTVSNQELNDENESDKNVMDEYREKANALMLQDKPVNWIAAFVIVCIWIGLAILAVGIA